MKSFVTDAINIKTYPLSENDNIVVMFSKQKGLIKGVAKGVKRPKSKLGARMQMLVANKLMLYKGKSLDVICQAEALNTFNKLRCDLDKLTYSMYLAEIIGNFCTETPEEFAKFDDNNEEIYNLFYKTLENIANSENKTKILLSVLKFQLKFMCLAGYGLEFETCLFCAHKIEGNALFSLSNGGVSCKDCSREGGHKIKLHQKIREFLIALSKTQIEKSTKYDELANEKVCNTCFMLLRRYIDTQSPRPSRALSTLSI